MTWRRRWSGLFELLHLLLILLVFWLAGKSGIVLQQRSMRNAVMHFAIVGWGKAQFVYNK